MQIGDIIYVDNLKFFDGQYDTKKNRPCVYLGKKDGYVYCLPITSNKKRLKYETSMFLPEQLYSYKKLCFVNVLQVTQIDEQQIQTSPYKLLPITLNILINKIYDCKVPKSCYDFYNELKEQIYYENIIYCEHLENEQKVKKIGTRKKSKH